MIKYYWDSCAFISRIQGDKKYIRTLEYLTDKAAEGEVQIVTSALSVAEVCYLDKESSLDQKLREIDVIAQFFDNDYIFVIQVSRRISEEAAKIAVKHKVKPPDAIHLATAIHANCQIVHTYDENRLLKLNGLVGDPPLTIRKPSAEIQTELFDDDSSSQEPEEPEPAASWRVRKCEVLAGSHALSPPSSRIWGRQHHVLVR